jgi:putative NADPH-quinone reductase
MPTALVIDGHPDAQSLTAELVHRYAAAHGDARVLALRDLEYDPHLRFGYRERMPLEPDLAEAKAALKDAVNLVVATPLWWGSVPALQ